MSKIGKSAPKQPQKSAFFFFNYRNLGGASDIGTSKPLAQHPFPSSRALLECITAARLLWGTLEVLKLVITELKC